jgi:hypothetical protein
MVRRGSLVSHLLLGMLISAGSLLIPQISSGADMSSEITVSAGDYAQYRPDVAYNSVHDEYLVVWHDIRPGHPTSIQGARYSSTGVLIAKHDIWGEVEPWRDNMQPSVAYDPVRDRYLVVWVRDAFGDGSDWDVVGRFVPWDGPVWGGQNPTPDPFWIDYTSGNQWYPRVAYGGTDEEFMVAWWNEAGTGVAASVYAQRVDASGGLSGSRITVSSGAIEDRTEPDIAYNQARNEYIISYQRVVAGDPDIYGVRLAGNGAILGGGDFGIAAWPDPESKPRIAASRVSNTWAVVWHSEVAPSDKDVYARLVWVDGAGTVQMAAPVLIASTAFNDRQPDVGAHPESSGFLVTWTQQYSNTSGPYGVEARVLRSSGVLGAVFAPRPIYVGDTTNCSHPVVAGGVNDWMVAWEHDRHVSPSYQDIHGRVLFSEIFTDGFESNDTTSWSSSAP